MECHNPTARRNRGEGSVKEVKVMRKWDMAQKILERNRVRRAGFRLNSLGLHRLLIMDNDMCLIEM